MVKRRLHGKQPAPEDFRPSEKRRKLELVQAEEPDLLRMVMGLQVRASDGILGKARAFSYLILCSDAECTAKMLSQLPRPVLRATLEILIEGSHKEGSHREESLLRGRLASLPSNVVTKTLGGVNAYQVKFMWHDLKVESVWTMNYSQAMDWHRSLSSVRKATTDRIAMARKEDPKSVIVPLTVPELAEAFVMSPSLELTFVSLHSLNGKRISTLYSSNYRLALQQWQGLRDLIETHKYSKPKELDKIVESFRSQAARMVELEKLRFASRERHLIACVSGAIERGNVKVSHELHKIMGINDLCISADEIAARIQEASPQMVTKLRSYVATFFRDPKKQPKEQAVVNVRLSRKQQEKATSTSPFFAERGGQLLPQVLTFLSLKQVFACRKVSTVSMEASSVNLRLRLSNFLYTADFLSGISQTRSGRPRYLRVETQARQLVGLLSAPGLSTCFQDLDLRDAPREAVAATCLAPCLMKMVSLRSLSLTGSKEWARENLRKICEALPQGASCECYDANKPHGLISQYVQGELSAGQRFPRQCLRLPHW